LSIMDPVSGHQPMHNENSSLWITFNGEIFNHLELRRDLEKRGHHFSTHSDTEVILHRYEEVGQECVHDLNGQWAFALWDAKKRQLFLSRDRMGIRPLYYSIVNKTFLFASEMKSLFTYPDLERAIDLRGLDQIFTFWCTVPPQTIFKGVQELAPGHSLVVGKDGVRDYFYWQHDFDARPPIRNEAELADELLDLLEDATRLQLRSDVPVGSYLSGGLDSTLIAALVKRVTRAPMKTFSVTFDDPEFDESSYQNEAVRFLQTDHQTIQCTRPDIAREFPNVIWHTEQPVLRTAPVPLYELSRLVHDSGFKVVLTGEGSDEIFGGYDIFKEAKIRRFCAAFPDSTRRPRLLKRLYPYLPELQGQSVGYLQSFFKFKAENRDDLFFSHTPRWDLTSMLKTFFSRATHNALQACDSRAELQRHLPEGYPQWGSLNQAQYLEAAYLLPGYILSSQGDRMAMAHSVVGRFPFLDHRVVEFASKLPAELKLKVLNEKYLLKRSAKGLVPPSIRKRSKQPYRAPEALSFLNGSRESYVDEMLSPTRIREDGIFDLGAVQKLKEKVERGSVIGTKDNMALIGILSTELVIDRFIRRFRNELPLESNGARKAEVHC
jgi:asparagine synthase (glutamine-hydrolysing)